MYDYNRIPIITLTNKKASAMIKQRAFLKYAGGKYSVMEHIHEMLPKGDVLVEPFVGAGNVFLNTDYEHYILADANPVIIDLYQTLQKHGKEFIADCQVYFTGKHNTQETYYEIRDQFNKSIDSYERSVLFVYLNRHCFNGLCRFNKSGGFNVSYGKYKAPYFPQDEMVIFYEKSAKAEFHCLSFRDTFKRVENNHIVYCDPPYIPLSITSNFTSYNGDGFTHIDQQDLRDLAEKTNTPVLLSNHDTRISRELYSSASIRAFDIQRSISCKGKERTRAKELLALFNGRD